LKLAAKKTEQKPLSSEDSVHTFGVDLVKPVEDLYHILTGHELDASVGQVSTTDGSVRTDRLVCDGKSGDVVHIVVEEKSVAVGRHYITEIIELAKNGKLGFDGDINLPHWKGEKGVIGRVRTAKAKANFAC
jgi:hypothetical protein